MIRLVLFLFVTSCAGGWVQTELFFGLSNQEGVISDAEWQKFVQEEVSKRLPDGFTLIEASGQWRNDKGAVIREPSRVLVLLHPTTPAFENAIEELRRLYAARFHQELVLRADVPARVWLTSETK